MHIRIAGLSLVVLLAACGGAAPGQTSKPNGATPAATPGGHGAVDCAAMTTAATQLVAVQLLAQLTTPATVESIRSKQIGNLDLDAFLSAMGTLHALDAHASPLGDPKASIEHYEKAAEAAKDLFAMEPVTQAAIDAFNKDNVGTVGDFLGKQIAISGAMGEAGC